MIRGYRPDLDGVRTIAVYLVLLFHSGLDWANGGYIGVDLFFCLSGFLVTGVLLGEQAKNGSIRIGRFYARRVRRLLPAAVVVVVGTCLTFTLLWSVVTRVPLIGDARSSLLYYANWHFLASSGDYFATDVDKSPFLHFWSLSIEEQYYAFFPLLLLLLTWLPVSLRRKVTIGVLAGLLLASLVLQVVLARDSVDRAYYGTDTRLYQLLAGALLTVWMSGSRWRPGPRLALLTALAGLAGVLVLGTGLITVGPSWRGIGATVASVALLGGLAYGEHSVLARVLAHQVPAFLGRISYGTYLWHWPVIVALGALMDAGPVATAALAASIATGLAALSYQIFEMPVRRWPWLDPFGWRVASIGVATSAVVAVAVIAPVLSTDRQPAVAAAGGNGASAAVEKNLQKALNAKIPDIDFTKANAGRERGDEHWCTTDDPEACTVVHGSGQHVLLVGDSQAETLVPVFEQLAKEHDLTLSVNVIAGCPWQEELTNDHQAATRSGRCTKARVGWYDNALRKLDPDVVVLLDRPRDDPGEWGEQLRLRSGETLPLAEAAYTTTRATLAKITRVAPAVVVERLVMPLAFDAVDCLASADRVGQCAVPVPAQPSPSDGYVQSIAAVNPDVHPVSLVETYCPTAPICLPIDHGTVVWRDVHHYTVTWAMERRQALWEVLRGTGLLD